ncbi:hypothetical protein P8452_42526 [Trifolium repens]|nr:hypothetical protein P8452_42526 [Trifolium repens]
MKGFAKKWDEPMTKKCVIFRMCHLLHWNKPNCDFIKYSRITMTLLLLTKQVAIKSSMHKQQVCSVLISIEALTREKERDPKMSHK